MSAHGVAPGRPSTRLAIRVLGCGTSTGVPVVGCRCAVCRSQHPGNRRLRSSLHLAWNGASVLVDTTPDLREQALRYGVDRVDAVLYTHAHADHIHGFDELRVFGFLRDGEPIPCWASTTTLERLRRTFSYAFEPGSAGGGKPRVELHEIERRGWNLFGIEVLPIPILHGAEEILGYRFGPFAYLTDCSQIPDRSFELLRGVELLIVDGLRWRPHPTHFSIAEATAAAARIGARRTWLTHLSHEVEYDEATEKLPEGVFLAVDGLEIEVDVPIAARADAVG